MKVLLVNGPNHNLPGAREPAIEWEARRKTLVAERTDRRTDGGAALYRFDIRLQGEDKTVFFDV